MTPTPKEPKSECKNPMCGKRLNDTDQTLYCEKHSPASPEGKENFCPHGAKEKECPVLGCAYFPPASGGEKEDTGWEGNEGFAKIVKIMTDHLSAEGQEVQNWSYEIGHFAVMFQKLIVSEIAKAESRGREEAIDILEDKQEDFNRGKRIGREEGRRIIELILPLAKGYVRQHMVPSTLRYIEEAESFLTSNQDKKL